ncbi:MAG: hypothetical protein JSS65_02750 [Armatimonadetes bacterium]|nr:hypothetical protein [Armatimonadota bacterium]
MSFCLATQQVDLADAFSRFGDETMGMVDVLYHMDREPTFAAAIKGRQATKEQATMWDMAVLLSATAAAMHYDAPRYRDTYSKIMYEVETYWDERGPEAGYCVLPKLKEPDRYYDDNAWVALAQIEGFEWGHRASDLARARKTLAFVLSGKDRKSGGIFWHEQDRKSMNVCATANTGLVAAKLFNGAGKAEDLATAKALDAWCDGMRDGDDIYWDSRGVDGKVDRTKWSYNTALPIRLKLELFKVTKDDKYKGDALKIAVAAQKKWVKVGGVLDDEVAFAHHLVDAFLDCDRLDRTGPWRDLAVRAALALRDKCRSEYGMYGLRWGSPEVRENEGHRLLFQASAARTFYSVAGALKENP